MCALQARMAPARMIGMSDSEIRVLRRPIFQEKRCRHVFLTPVALFVAIMAIGDPARAEQGGHVGAAHDTSVLADRAMLGRLTQGPMRKFKFAEEPKTLPGIDVVDRAGVRTSLAKWSGRMVLLNVWASWCAPCREEMPALARLHDRLAPSGIDIVTLSIDKTPADALVFLRELGLDDLPVLLDADMAAAKALGAQGAPTSILIDEAGRELGRIEGAADWESAEAMLLLKAIRVKSQLRGAGAVSPAKPGR